MIVYLDSSAFLKLVREERESPALQSELEAWPDRASSALLAVEVLRVSRAAGGPELARAAQLLGDVALLPVSEARLDAAVGVDPPLVRSLDAIHVATAVSMGDELGAMITYDRRMLVAAEVAGIEALAPGW